MVSGLMSGAHTLIACQYELGTDSYELGAASSSSRDLRWFLSHGKHLNGRRIHAGTKVQSAGVKRRVFALVRLTRVLLAAFQLCFDLRSFSPCLFVDVVFSAFFSFWQPCPLSWTYTDKYSWH